MQNVDPLCNLNLSTGSYSFVDVTCQSIKYIGLPLGNDTNEWGDSVKYAVIDLADSSLAKEHEFNYFKRWADCYEKFNVEAL